MGRWGEDSPAWEEQRGRGGWLRAGPALALIEEDRTETLGIPPPLPLSGGNSPGSGHGRRKPGPCCQLSQVHMLQPSAPQQDPRPVSPQVR